MSLFSLPLSFTRFGFARMRSASGPPIEQTGTRGRVALVTGANSGIGLAAAKGFAKAGFRTWLLCRDSRRGETARDAIVAEVLGADVEVAQVDLASMASIRDFGATFAGRQVDVLVHNAGGIQKSFVTTSTGLETTFAASVVGPYLLTALLAPLIANTAGRVIFVASAGAYLSRYSTSELLDSTRYDGLASYARAKRAQILLAEALAKRVPRAQIRFFSMHPGWVATRSLREGMRSFYWLTRPALRSPDEGADSILWLATSSQALNAPNGSFWFDRSVARKHMFTRTQESQGDAAALLDLCASLSGESFCPKEPLASGGSGR